MCKWCRGSHLVLCIFSVFQGWVVPMLLLVQCPKLLLLTLQKCLSLVCFGRITVLNKFCLKWNNFYSCMHIPNLMEKVLKYRKQDYRLPTEDFFCALHTMVYSRRGFCGILWDWLLWDSVMHRLWIYNRTTGYSTFQFHIEMQQVHRDTILVHGSWNVTAFLVGLIFLS